MDYFIDQWFLKLPGWYEGFTSGRIQSTNNALESCNGKLKSESTFRKLSPLEDFLQTVTDDILYNWTSDRDDSRAQANLKSFATEPSSIELKHYDKALKWMNEARNIVMQKVDGVKTYFVSSSQFEKTAITTKDVDKYLEALLQSNWRSFDSMIRDINSLRSVVINSVSWKLSTCSCPDFYKNNLCKHIIGICAQLKIGDFEIPIESKFLPIGQKKKERST